jgi:hypothetical protein
MSSTVMKMMEKNASPAATASWAVARAACLISVFTLISLGDDGRVHGVARYTFCGGGRLTFTRYA